MKLNEIVSQATDASLTEQCSENVIAMLLAESAEPQVVVDADDLLAELDRMIAEAENGGK